VSETSKDQVFLAYANYSLREDPKNFFKIYDVYDRSHTSLADFIAKKDLRTQIEAVVECEFSKKAFVQWVISEKPAQSTA